MNWISENKEWLFSGAAISLLSLIIYFFKKKSKSNNDTTNDSSNININNNVCVNNNTNQNGANEKLQLSKESVQVLFIDDEKFKIVENLKKAGYINTKTIWVY